MALKILTRGADGAPRSFFFYTVPKWGPTVVTGIMAATLVAMFVVGSVIGFAYVAPLASRSYTVVDSAGNTLEFVRSLADEPYTPASRGLINVRAEHPAASLRQTIQMVPDLLRDSHVLVRDIQTQLATGAKFELALASALRASGLRTPAPPPRPAPPARPRHPRAARRGRSRAGRARAARARRVPRRAARDPVAAAIIYSAISFHSTIVRGGRYSAGGNAASQGATRAAPYRHAARRASAAAGARSDATYRLAADRRYSGPTTSVLRASASSAACHAPAPTNSCVGRASAPRAGTKRLPGSGSHVPPWPCTTVRMSAPNMRARAASTAGWTVIGAKCTANGAGGHARASTCVHIRPGMSSMPPRRIDANGATCPKTAQSSASNDVCSRTSTGSRCAPCAHRATTHAVGGASGHMSRRRSARTPRPGANSTARTPRVATNARNRRATASSSTTRSASASSGSPAPSSGRPGGSS